MKGMIQTESPGEGRMQAVQGKQQRSWGKREPTAGEIREVRLGGWVSTGGHATSSEAPQRPGDRFSGSGRDRKNYQTLGAHWGQWEGKPG